MKDKDSLIEEVSSILFNIRADESNATYQGSASTFGENVFMSKKQAAEIVELCFSVFKDTTP